jgi:hypothetical protein
MRLARRVEGVRKNSNSYRIFRRNRKGGEHFVYSCPDERIILKSYGKKTRGRGLDSCGSGEG